MDEPKMVDEVLLKTGSCLLCLRLQKNQVAPCFLCLGDPCMMHDLCFHVVG